MKKILLVLSVGFSSFTFAQPKLISQAIVSTTTNIIAPEDEDVQNIQNPGGSGMNFRNFMDGETKSTTYLKNDMVKTVLKAEIGRSTIIRNNTTKITTTLLEVMGNKTGFAVTDEEQAAMKKRTDSMMQARRHTDSSVQQRPAESPKQVEVAYVDGTKKIAGYECKKAYLISANFLGIKDSVTVWFNPEIKLQNVASTGGLSAFGNMGSVPGLETVEGFVMSYEMKMPRKRRMQVDVTKIDLQKEVADKEFEIPKDFELKSMREVMGMFGQGMRRGGQ